MFAGVGGIDIGLDATGMECLFQVEIDSNCQQTLSYHWPDVPKFGDIKDVSGYDLPFVDVITFGSPCQDLSVAGKRAGLEGEKSGLFHEAVRIIKEMREKSNGQYPKWSIWENVVGALSTNNGADFGQVLWEMDEAGACFSEWAVLDAQHFGVPQRRRRVFLVSCFDPTIAARCPQKILPVKEGSSRNFEKSGKKREENSREIASSLRSSGQGGISSSIEENLAVKTTDINAYRMTAFGEYADDDTASTIKSRDYKDATDLVIGFSHTQGLDPQASQVAWPTLRAEGGGHAVSIRQYVRRLTPIECERLMGWPDNHTLYRADGKLNSDSSRYRMCGNGVASPVIKWIIDQIKEI